MTLKVAALSWSPSPSEAVRKSSSVKTTYANQSEKTPPGGKEQSKGFANVHL